MSHPRSEAAPEHRVDRAAMPWVELFSHPPRAEVYERPSVVGHGDGVDWRATPFSDGAPGQRRGLLADEED
jgi:hypothetical protein